MSPGQKIATFMLVLMIPMVFLLSRSENELGKVETIEYSIDSTQDVVHFSWDTVRNADGYQVYVCLAEKKQDYVLAGEVERAQADIKGFIIGKNYSVKVRPFKEVDGQKNYGQYSNAVTFSYGRYDLV